MSATLGALLRLLEPDWSITLIERLDGAAAESSDPWNNAGTGHSALCELNYTPAASRRHHRHQPRRSTSTSSSRSRASSGRYARRERRAARRAQLPQPDPARELRARRRATSTTCRRRHEALVGNPLFASMEYIDDHDEFARRLPLMAAKRDFSDPVALNWTQDGTDVDFGSLSRAADRLRARSGGMTTLFGHEVRDLRKESDGSWTLKVTNRRTGAKRKINAKFVFVGAGGGALPLLQKSGIKEAKGFGGFPVGGAVPAHRQPGAGRRAPGQGVRPAAAGCAADVGAALGHPRHQRQVLAAVRPVRRLVAEVPQAGQGHRPAAARSSRTTWRRCSASGSPR